MRILHFTIFLVLITMLFGCTGFSSNNKLIGNYGLVAVDDEQQTCICYFEPTDSNRGCIPVVTQTVFSIGFSSQYIIAQQHPNNNRKIINYFIVPINYTHKHWGDNYGSIGPLTINQFNEKRKELNIPNSLTFTIVKNDLK